MVSVSYTHLDVYKRQWHGRCGPGQTVSGTTGQYHGCSIRPKTNGRRHGPVAVQGGPHGLVLVSPSKTPVRPRAPRQFMQ
ncbi:hypothetical protein PHJA_001019500 [Phtheirospermum japonicum]|uniref:Uncharacterized protein n=1 Tax=Phtheirospermum japonicum TaxID=374723 RepID=A0A830BUX5_9LAMI|nr:hypothetical protein PHJA_001019500 [Phtheirospermum japonicum]